MIIACLRSSRRSVSGCQTLEGVLTHQADGAHHRRELKNLSLEYRLVFNMESPIPMPDLPLTSRTG
jgi:hypothetical protein